MKTDVQNEAPAAAGWINEEVPLGDEAASLLELTKHKVNRDNLTPCPSCNILVHIKLNHCPHCNSDIAANNALMRESLRRLAEIRAHLDGEHQAHVENHIDGSKKPSVGDRIKRFFSDPQTQEEAEPALPDPKGPRVLDTIAAGDQLKVLEDCDPWYKVKTRDGKTGWVYSTLIKEP